MQPLEWYQDYPLTEGGGIMLDAATKFIGVARLRQHRVAANTCSIPDIIKFTNMTCWPEFSESSAETSNFGPAWSQYELDADKDDYMKENWKYKSGAITQTLQTMGLYQKNNAIKQQKNFIFINRVHIDIWRRRICSFFQPKFTRYFR